MTTVYPSDNFRCADGELMLIVGNDNQFRGLCSALDLHGVPDDPQFATNAARLINAAALGPVIADAMARRTLAECQAALDAAGVPASPIQNVAEVFASPQVQARRMVLEFPRSDGGAVRTIASPIRMSRTPPRYSRPPPALGGHGAEVLQEVLGLTERDCADLVKDGTVGG